MFKIEENNIFLTRGDSANIHIKVIAIGGKEYKVTSGDTITFTVKKSTNDTTILIQKQGQEITIEPDDTSRLSYGKYVYDVQLNMSTGEIDTIITPHEFNLLEEVNF